MDTEFIKGTLSMLILSLLSRRAMYGYEIASTVGEETRNIFELKAGSLYPSLHNLEKEGLIRGEWQGEDNKRQRKYYQITEAGTAYLARKTDAWQQVTRAVNSVLENSHGQD